MGYQIPTTDEDATNRSPGRDPVRRYGAALVIAGVTVIALWIAVPLWGGPCSYAFALLAVVFAAAMGGFGPALICLFVTLGGMLLLLASHIEINWRRVGDRVGIVVYLCCGIAAALIVEFHRRSLRRWANHHRETLSRHGNEIAAQAAKRKVVDEEATWANAELAEAKAQSVETLNVLDALVMNAPMGLALLDTDLRFVRINQYFAESNGRPIAEHIGKRAQEVLPNLPHSFFEDLRAVLATGAPISNRHVATQLANRNDSVWQTNYYPVRNTKGELIGVGVAALHISAQLEAQRQLRASEARFRLLTESIPQLIWIADWAGRSTHFNRRWKEYTGLDPDLAIEQGWRNVVHSDDVEPLATAWQSAVISGESAFTHEFRLRRADGEYLWHLANAKPLRNANGDIIEWVSALTDIDLQKRHSDALDRMVQERTAALGLTVHVLKQEVEERRRAEFNERAMSLELRRSNEDLEQFANIASHDLQEPLRKVQAFGNRLRAKFREQLGEEGSDYIDRMDNSLNRMQQLIDDLLNYSRVTTLARPFVSVDLNSIVADVLNDLEVRIVQTGGRVDVDELPTIEADGSQMHQLLLNLIGNALKFHKPGLSPEVRVAAEIVGDRLNGSRSDTLPAASYRITVADNGIGFEERHRERLFQMFQRLHGRHKVEGSGVGLAICRKIVERHAGTITAHSQPEHGATFEIVLPAKHEPPSNASRQAETESVEYSSAEANRNGQPV